MLPNSWRPVSRPSRSARSNSVLGTPLTRAVARGRGDLRSLGQNRCSTAIGRAGGRFNSVPFPSPGIEVGHRLPGGLPSCLARWLPPRIGAHTERPRRAIHSRTARHLLFLVANAFETIRPECLQGRHWLVTSLPQIILRHFPWITARGLALVEFEAGLHYTAL
jgi:hypothetical protein